MKKTTTLNVTCTAFLIAIGIQSALAINVDRSIADVNVTDPSLSIVRYAIDSTEHWIRKVDAKDHKRIQKLSGELAKHRTRLFKNKSGNKNEVQALISHVDYLDSILSSPATESAGKSKDTTASKQTVSATAAVANTPVHPNLALVSRKLDSLQRLIDAGRIETHELPDSLKPITKIFKTVPANNDPRYATVAIRLKQFDSQANKGRNEINMTVAEIETFLKERQQFYRSAIPRIKFTANGSLTATAVDAYVKALTSVSNARTTDLPKLQKIVVATGKGKSLLSWLENESPKEVKRNSKMYEQLLKGHVQYYYTQLEKQAQLSPKQHPHAFSNPRKAAKDDKHYQRVSDTLAQAARLESMLGKNAAYAKASQQFDQWLVSWRSHFETAAASRKLPADIGDKSLARIAKKVLANDKYGISGWEKIIVNAPVRTGDSIDHKSTRSGIETIIREWQEFQVATIEKEGSKYYLYYNTVKKFKRAPRTTPLNRWILSKRINGGEVHSSTFN